MEYQNRWRASLAKPATMHFHPSAERWKAARQYSRPHTEIDVEDVSFYLPGRCCSRKQCEMSSSECVPRLKCASIYLCAGELHHLGPFFSFVCDEPSEVARRACKRFNTNVGKPCLDLGIGKTGVDFRVEPIDNLHGRVLGRGHAEPAA